MGVQGHKWRRGSIRRGTYARIFDVICGLVPGWMTHSEWDDGEVIDLEGGCQCGPAAW